MCESRRGTASACKKMASSPRPSPPVEERDGIFQTHPYEEGQNFFKLFPLSGIYTHVRLLAPIFHTSAKTASVCSRRRQSALASFPRKSAPTDVGGYGGWEIFRLVKLV